MKTIMLSVLLSTSITACNNTVESTPVVDVIEPIEQMSIELLIDAMIYVESKGDSTAIGDGGRAVGVLQIWKIMVDDVNRILGRRGISYKYTYNDRYNRDKSIDMFLIWHDYYHKYASYEKVARCWNGGPMGYTKHCTKNYWYKVSYYMDQLAWAN